MVTQNHITVYMVVEDNVVNILNSHESYNQKTTLQ